MLVRSRALVRETAVVRAPPRATAGMCQSRRTPRSTRAYVGSRALLMLPGRFTGVPASSPSSSRLVIEPGFHDRRRLVRATAEAELQTSIAEEPVPRVHRDRGAVPVARVVAGGAGRANVARDG